jgi:hypothetical protein
MVKLIKINMAWEHEKSGRDQVLTRPGRWANLELAMTPAHSVLMSSRTWAYSAK